MLIKARGRSQQPRVQKYSKQEKAWFNIALIRVVAAISPKWAS
jgi:hypothetical protein